MTINLNKLSKEEYLELVKRKNQELEQMGGRLQEQTKRLEEKDQQLAQQASTITGCVRMGTGIVKMVEIAKKHKDELLRQIKELIIYPEDEIGRTAIDCVYELIVEQLRLITETNRLTQQLYGTSSEKTPQEITKQVKEALEEIKLSRSVKNSRDRLINLNKLTKRINVPSADLLDETLKQSIAVADKTEKMLPAPQTFSLKKHGGKASNSNELSVKPASVLSAAALELCPLCHSKSMSVQEVMLKLKGELTDTIDNVEKIGQLSVAY